MHVSSHVQTLFAGLSVAYTTGGETTEAECLATVQRARELGVTMLDSANAYGFGANEQLLSELALHLGVVYAPVLPPVLPVFAMAHCKQVHARLRTVCTCEHAARQCRVCSSASQTRIWNISLL
jgi:hypothetical protein